MEFQGDVVTDIKVSDIGLAIGTILQERYQINEYISLGNMTVMYKALDSKLGQNVLIKELAPFAMVNRDLGGLKLIPRNKVYKEKLDILKSSFEQETNLLIELSDEKYGLTGYIPGYMNHFAENNTNYLVMKYYEGKDLQKRIEEGEILNFRQLALGIIEIVNKVHGAGVLHRDIKLSNIFLKNDGEIVLLDFGSACKFADEASTIRYVSNGFSPPELYTENVTTRWVDNFTIGAVFYQMLTGLKPIRINSKNEMHIVDIDNYVNLPWPISWMIMKLLELKPEKRLKKLWVIKMLL